MDRNIINMNYRKYLYRPWTILQGHVDIVSIYLRYENVSILNADKSSQVKCVPQVVWAHTCVHHPQFFLFIFIYLFTLFCLNIKHFLAFHFSACSHSLERLVSGEVLHLRNILFLKLQEYTIVQSCFTTSGSIETIWNYCLSNFFCKGENMRVHSDIEAQSFGK